MIDASAQLPDLHAAADAVRFATMQAKLDTARALGRTEMVLFGCGYLGKSLLRALRALGLQPLAFTDNNPTLWGQEVENLPVLAPAEAANRFRDRAVFVISVFTQGPVRRQLEAWGLSILSFPELTWCFPDHLLPCGSLHRPSFFGYHAPAIQAALELWADEASRAEFIAQIIWRTTLDGACLGPGLPHEQIYFPEDLVAIGPADTIVDCGAYNGDTLRAVLSRVPLGPKRYYAVEPDATNLPALRACIDAQGPAIAQVCSVYSCALGRESQVLKFVHEGSVGSHVSEEGAAAVQVRRLDDLLAEAAPTYLKMDIEGAERAALEGAGSIIRKHLPVLAVALYHQAQDLWELPLLIRSLGPDYRLYLRRYSDDCWEMVCYAIPRHRLRTPPISGRLEREDK